LHPNYWQPSTTPLVKSSTRRLITNRVKMVDGMFQHRKTVRPGVHQIKFSIFPADTIFTLKSANHNVVSLGLNAAALAISLVAWNWVEWQAHDAGKHDFAKHADAIYKQLFHVVFHRSNSPVTRQEQVLIRQYMD
jgi:hypothetical protein